MPERKKNDALLKSAFEDYFVHLLHFFFPNANQIFDLEKGFIFMDKELLEIFPDRSLEGGNRVADLLVKLYMCDQTEQWILLHTEIQGADSDDFALRMYQYHYRLFDRYRMKVASLVVFTGARNQVCPCIYKTELLGTELTFRYPVFQIFNHSEEELLAMDNLFALTILAAQKEVLADNMSPVKLNLERLKLAKALIFSGRYDKPTIRSFLTFLKLFLYISDEKINHNFDNETTKLLGGSNEMGIIEYAKEQARMEGLNLGMQEGMQKGIQEGMQKGIQEGMQKGIQEGIKEGMQKGRLEGKYEGYAEIVNNLLHTGMSVEQVAAYTRLSIEQINMLSRKYVR